MQCVTTMGDTVGVICRTTYVYHMIFRGDNTPKIHSVALYGAFTRSDVCLYTPPILNAVQRK